MVRGIDTITRGLYWLLAVAMVLVGMAVVLVGTGIVPSWARDEIFALGHNTPLAMHLLQEMGALYVLIGLLFAWFARHYDRSYHFHWAVTLTFALIAFVHWFSPYGRFDNEPRALINAIPFAVFLVLGLLRSARS